jgi:hypothetical protein
MTDPFVERRGGVLFAFSMDMFLLLQNTCGSAGRMKIDLGINCLETTRGMDVRLACLIKPSQHQISFWKYRSKAHGPHST